MWGIAQLRARAIGGDVVLLTARSARTIDSFGPARADAGRNLEIVVPRDGLAKQRKFKTLAFSGTIVNAAVYLGFTP
jgi:hypothetical protein